MAQKLQKLELTWIGKGNEPKLEPRILIEDPAKSFGDTKSENMLIHGDNLLALKALEQNFSNRIKCIYIDPPYNSNNAFTHYDDGVEHSEWLKLMKPRLDYLRSLLSKEGVIFISISDDESHYLKILCDEVFGRSNYCGTFIWEKKRKPSYLNSQMGVVTEYVLAFAKNRKEAPPFIIGKVSDSETYPLYNAGNSRGLLKFPSNSMTFLKHKDGNYKPQEFKEDTSLVKLLTELIVKDGRNANEVTLEGEWRYGQETINEQIKNGDYYVVKSLKFRPRRVFENKDEAKKIHNLLSRAHFDMATYEDATSESIALFGNNPFDYPKPEKLIYTLINAVTEEGDFVLDSFLGSGTTSAVAHKMNRKWIGIELGDHAVTHCLPRLEKVVSGKDKGGVTEAANWKGGGGFKFYTLAPSLILKDKYGNEIINPAYNPNQLAAAMSKQEGFQYSPDESIYWKQGRSSEKDFIFTTTQFVTVEMLERLHNEMKPNENLLVCCKSFKKECAHRFANITIKKIPQMVLGRCEFGRDDYSLNIINLPHEDDNGTHGADEIEEAVENPKRKKVKEQIQPKLF